MIACANALHLPLADQSVYCVVTSPATWRTDHVNDSPLFTGTKP